MSYEQNIFLPYLIVVATIIFMLVLIYLWRRSPLFSKQNQLSSTFSCALLWAGIMLIPSIFYMFFSGHWMGLILAIKTGIFESLRTGMVGIYDVMFLIVTPIYALFGALFGASFLWLNRANKASGSALQRSLIGFLLGLAVTVIITAIGTFLFMTSQNISFQQLINDPYAIILMIIWAVILAVIIIVLSLITPRHLLVNVQDRT
jgi:hypothetical protein